MLFCRLLPFFLLALTSAPAFELRLPTVNRGLFSGDYGSFYMYTARNYKGRSSKPWQGGTYGYSRNPVMVGGKLFYSKFHEGVDIKPVRRDPNGEPLDLVCSISKGRVVHVSPIASKSNYGKYVVVEHAWPSGRFYSLYAHLMTTQAQIGQPVKAGTPLGRLGYTGRGIDKTRAHVHLELNMLLSEDFAAWHDRFLEPGGGTHGNYNGINLVGIDIAQLYLTHRKKRSLTMKRFVQSMPVHYKVTVPPVGRLSIARNYPWLIKSKLKNAPSWELSFSGSGVPLAINRGKIPVEGPQLTWVRPSLCPHSYITRKVLSGRGREAKLTAKGRNYITLVTENF